MCVCVDNMIARSGVWKVISENGELGCVRGGQWWQGVRIIWVHVMAVSELQQGLGYGYAKAID